MKQVLLMMLSLLMLPSCSTDDVLAEVESPVPPASPTRYTLAYHANGATVGTVPTAVVADAGTTITLGSGNGLGRDGYTFVGWNTNSSGSGTDHAAGSHFTLSGSITLYAKWDITTNSNSMKITIGTTVFKATLSQSPTVTAFKAMLPMTLEMSDFNRNEKVASLPHSLTTAASNPGTIRTGDVMLYGQSSLVVFYETFSTSYSYIRIGRIDNPDGLKAALGGGNITLTFELE